MILMEKLRREKGWSAAELARQASLNAATISNLENGYMRKPFPAQAQKIADALGVENTLALYDEVKV